MGPLNVQSGPNKTGQNSARFAPSFTADTLLQLPPHQLPLLLCYRADIFSALKLRRPILPSSSERGESVLCRRSRLFSWERMEDDAGSQPSGGGDKLVLRGLVFHGFHGAKEEERKLGQKFLVDVDAWMDLRAAGTSDSLSDTISYTEIYRIAKQVLEGPPRNLLESVAELIASTTLSKFPQISAVRVKVGKPHVAVPGTLDYLGVEITRSRKSSSSKSN